MSTIAYGLGQGFASGADSVANAVATAERIKNNREQLRIQNQYAQLAQDKWGVQKQQEELAIREATMKLDAIENEMAADKAANFLVDGWEYGNYKQFQNFMLTDQRMKNIMKTLGYVNVEGLNDYTDSSIDTITGNPELAKQIRQNKNGYLVITDSQGNKKIVDTMLVGGMMGIQRRVNMARILRMQTQQERIAEQAETLGAKAKLVEAQKNPELFGSQEALELRRTISPQGNLTSTSGRESVYDKKEAAENNEIDQLKNIDVKRIDTDEALAKKEDEILFDIVQGSNNENNKYVASSLGIEKKLYELEKLGILNGRSLQEYADTSGDKNAKSYIYNYFNKMASVDKKLFDEIEKVDTWQSQQRAMMNRLTGIDKISDKPLVEVLKDKETLPIIDKAFSVVAAKAGEGATWIKDIRSIEAKSAISILFNAYMKELSGQNVTGNEVTRNYEALGRVDETSMSNVLAGLKNLILSDIEFEEERKQKGRLGYLVKVGTGKLDRMYKSLEQVDKLLYGIKGKSKQIAPQSGTTMQGNRKSLNEIFGSVGGQ